jgi:hypothetical protein
MGNSRDVPRAPTFVWLTVFASTTSQKSTRYLSHSLYLSPPNNSRCKPLSVSLVTGPNPSATLHDASQRLRALLPTSPAPPHTPGVHNPSHFRTWRPNGKPSARKRRFPSRSSLRRSKRRTGKLCRLMRKRLVRLRSRLHPTYVPKLTQCLYPTAYYVSFGPHGPRAPVSQPGDTSKIVFWTAALVAVGGVLFFAARAAGMYLFYDIRNHKLTTS